MNEISSENSSINQRCNAAANSDAQAKYSQQSLIRFINAERAVEINIGQVKTSLAALEDPSTILLAGFGTEEAAIRRKISSSMTHGRSKSDQDLLIMNYVTDRAKGVIAKGVKNPLARALDVNSLDIIYGVYSKALTDFSESIGQLNGSIASFSAIPLVPQDYAPRTPSRPAEPACGPGCVRVN